ncbi:hypothetical protein [Deinococcus murrayi]|uniref:hypothetical protein n=2 Tax=Deinococcus TaxID=1298 RepID=UPI0005592E75|nr:hypothetical protein [Deinococcus murrayi]
MAPAPSLNAYAPGTWARVASPVTWAAHTLTPGGMFGAKVVRGPLIVWAKGGGEGEDLPHLGLPQPSPLEVAAARLNMAPHFLAFQRATRGRGHISKGPRRGRRVGMLVLWRMKLGSKLGYIKKQALAWVVFLAMREARRVAGLRGATAQCVVLSPSEKKKARRSIEEERRMERLRALAPAWADESNPDGVDWEYLRELADNCYVAWQPEEQPEQFTFWKAGGARDMLAYALLTHDSRAARAIMRAMKRQARQASLALTLALRALEAAAYRAHLARRVKPVSRRTRAPRPLYARPRPPTAPLAPPLA